MWSRSLQRQVHYLSVIGSRKNLIKTGARLESRVHGVLVKSNSIQISYSLFLVFAQIHLRFLFKRKFNISNDGYGFHYPNSPSLLGTFSFCTPVKPSLFCLLIEPLSYISLKILAQFHSLYPLGMVFQSVKMAKCWKDPLPLGAFCACFYAVT